MSAAVQILLEARNVLVGQARGRFGKIAPERIADQALKATRDGDWPVQKAALDALARRYGFAKRDGLAVIAVPEGGAVLGDYRTGATNKASAKAGSRPYTTTLLGVAPLRTSCSCPDFVRSALGVCKHGLVVIDTLETRKRLVPPGTPSHEIEGAPRTLSWDPLAPLLGSTDRLARLYLAPSKGVRVPSGFSGGAPDHEILNDPAARMRLLRKLTSFALRPGVTSDPSVATLLAEELTAAERLADTRARAADGLARMKTLSRALYPYQREGVKRFLETGRLLLADDMGLGKTTQAIAACHSLFECKRISRGLLVVPASLKSQWKREWDATTGAPLTLVDGSPSERARIYQETKRGFLAMGYEQLLRDLPLVKAFDPEMLVLDEAQRIKNWATKSAAYVKSLTPRYRLVLTGTPMENRFDELASLMDIVDDVALEPKWLLGPLHTISRGDAHQGEGGARNLSSLRARLAPVFVRRIRHEVLAQLPPRTDTRIPVEMTDAQRDEHDELALPIARILAAARSRPLTQAEFLRLMSLLATQRMICNGLAQLRFDDVWPRLTASQPTEALLGELFAPKLSALRTVMEQVVVDQKRKVVVFSQWRRMLRLAEWSVRDVLGGAGLRAAFFTGAESQKLREQAIVEFHDDPRHAVLFLSDAGGVGLNLQRAASACINLELPWNPAVLEQRIGRIYRIGQKLPIDVYNLVSEEGIESRIAELLAKKKAVFSSLFDGTSDEVRFEGKSSFLEGVRKLVEPLPPVEIPTEVEAARDQAERSEDLQASEVVGAPDPQSEPTRADASPPLPPQVAAPEGPVPEPGEPEPAPRTTAPGIPGIRVERTEGGGIRIDAPAELAPVLASLFAQLAESLRAAAP